MRRKEQQKSHDDVIVLERMEPESGVSAFTKGQKEQVEALRDSLMGFLRKMGIKTLSSKSCKRQQLPELTDGEARAFRCLFDTYKQFRQDIKTDIETYRELLDLSKVSEEDLKKVMEERRLKRVEY